MSAVEILKQVKALPGRERRRLLRAVLSMEEEGLSHPAKRRRAVKWPDVEARARRVFGDRKMPNLVLLEREESSR